MLLAREEDELFKLASGELAVRGLTEGERHQRIEHTVVTGHAAVEGLAAENGDDVLGRDTALGRDALEQLAVLDPEINSCRDALFGDEMRPVLPPGEHALGRLLGALDDADLRHCMAQAARAPRAGSDRCGWRPHG
jgi:hypothetical protein